MVCQEIMAWPLSVKEAFTSRPDKSQAPGARRAAGAPRPIPATRDPSWFEFDHGNSGIGQFVPRFHDG